MPRNGLDVYALPAGTAAVSGIPANSTHVNSRFADLETDANTVRPVVAGGTGVDNLPDLLTALGAQPLDVNLTSLSGLSLVGSRGLYCSTTDTLALYTLTAYGRSLGGVADEAALKALINAEAGVDFQAYDANLTQLATPGAAGVLKLSDGTNYTDLAGGAAGTVLAGNGVGVAPSYQTKGRVYSSEVTTTGGTQLDSTGLFPSGTNIPPAATKVGIRFFNMSSTSPAGFLLRLGDSVGFIAANYVGGMWDDGGGDSTNTTGLVVATANPATDGFEGSAEIEKLPDGSWGCTAVGGNAVNLGWFGASYIRGSSMGGKTVDRLRLLPTAGTFDSVSFYFWYEV